MSETKICPDCGNDMDFHRLGCCYEHTRPLREKITQLQTENNGLKKVIEAGILRSEGQVGELQADNKRQEEVLKYIANSCPACGKMAEEALQEDQ